MRRRGYLLAYRTTSTVRDWPSRWMVRRMVSPTEWLRRTVSRSLVTDTTASGFLPPILHTADITDGHGTVRLQRPLAARNQCVTQDMATWLLWAEVPVSWADLSWAVANPALPPERLSLY